MTNWKRGPLSKRERDAQKIIEDTLKRVPSTTGSGGSVAWVDITGKPSTFAPSTHATSHQNGGSDEISVAGLSGLLADSQTPLSHAHSAGDITSGTLPFVRGGTGLAVLGSANQVLATNATTDAIEWQTPAGGGPVPAHASTHEDGGGDEIDVTNLSGLLADAQTPLAHFHAGTDINSGTVNIARLPTGTTSTTVALGDAAAGLIATHAAAADPHTGYQKESEKAAASGYASLDGSTKVPIAQIPTGTSGTTVALGNAAAGLITTHSGSSDHDGRYYTETEADTLLLAKVPTTRTISTTAPLAGGGDLSANRTLAISAGSTTGAGVVKVDHNSAGDPVALTAAGHGADFTLHTTVDENMALAGTQGAPSAVNPYVTEEDTRLTDARTPAGSAGGQLGGTYPNPDVRGIRETSGPTSLTIGTITDGQFLKRVGATLVSATPPGGGGGSLTVGTATLAFGAGLAVSYTSVDVTGLSGLTSASHIEAFLMNEASADRGADDNRVDPVDLITEFLTASSFRIYGTARTGVILGQVPVRWAMA